MAAARARRAFLVAVFGFVLLPGVLHLWSAWQAIRSLRDRPRAPGLVRAEAIAALALDVAGVAVAVGFLRSLAGR